MQADKPPTLVSRDLRQEVPERVRHDGRIDLPLDEVLDARGREGAKEVG